MASDDLNHHRQITDEQIGAITRSEELAYELRVEEVMTAAAHVVQAFMSMQQVLELFRSARISGAPVLDGEKLIGVISMEDLIRCLAEQDVDAPITKYMTPNVITVKKSDPVVEALKLFVSTKVGRLPVINEAGQLEGIITKGDVTRGLLKGLQRDYQVEEIRRYRASHLFEDIVSDRTSLILRYTIKANDFTHGGAASSAIKRALIRLGANPQIARRTGIAIYEAEMNLIIHTINGGIIRVEIEPHQISIEIYDDGPGIQDVDLAMKPGYSTAPEAIRELGFGAGMGLYNISRCVDTMKLESVFGKGTRLRLRILLKEDEAFGDSHSIN
jgi:CBS domain-containing protein